MNEHEKQQKEARLLNITELAEYLSVKEASIRSWVYKKKIPFIKVGKLVRFKVEDIELWLQSTKEEPR